MYEKLIDTEDLVAGLTFDTGHPVVHLTLPNGLTPSMFKYIKNELLEDCMVTLGTLGFPVLFSIIPEGDAKMLKFNKSLGFEEEVTEDGIVFLAQDIM